jgi:sugar lactone lactonase YvrE
LRPAQPTGLAIVPDGSLLIADGRSGRIYRANTKTGKLRRVVSGLGVAVDVAVAGKLICATAPHRIYRVVRRRGVPVAGTAEKASAGTAARR